jgi:hypothetical protein
VNAEHPLLSLTRALMIVLVCGSLQLAAQPKKATKIQLEDPELYHAFFRAHTDTDLKIQASAPAAASQVSASTAALYHISAGDLPKLTDEVRKFNVNLGGWSLDVRSYLNQQKYAKRKPDMKVLINYQWQRQRLVMNAHAAIHGTLTASSWTGLYGYINGDFKTALSQSKGAGK